jgi:two-component system sensor histidine kinase YesM
MLHKFRNIQTILFSTYSLIIVIVFTILVLWFYWWASDLLKANATKELENTGKSMQEQIDSEIHKMNDVSLNVLYSNLVKNHFKKYITDLENRTQSGNNGKDHEGTDSDSFPAASSSSIESAKELADILTAAIGPSRPVEQLYLYDFVNKVYGNGFDNGERSYDPAAKPWYKTIVGNHAGKLITLPVPDDEMTKYISSPEKQHSVSLLRLFYNNYNEPIGIVEVKQYYNRILKSVLDFKKGNPNQERVLVYNTNGDIIYPLHANIEEYNSYIHFSNTKLANQVKSFTSGFTNPATDQEELLSFHHSTTSGWTTVVIVSEKQLLSPLSSFARKTVLVAFLILIFAIILSYAAAKRITFPILKIHRTIRNIQLDDLGTGRVSSQELNSGLNELDQLHGSFLEMNTRLKQSMDDLLLSQSQELQAKLIALQTQMNPHFLYNTLATISAMAEENMNEQIIAMSENMSDILRYISSDQSSVPLETELLHTEKYLAVNHLRHGHKLQYAFDIDQRIHQLMVPKLIIQPLVENALKFATHQQPPWTIKVRGIVDNNSWRVSVTDNGPGFKEQSLALLDERIRELGLRSEVPVLQLNGMGLLNIYIRMKLTYGEYAVFEITNLETGGATITIGGNIQDEREWDNGK